MSGAHDLEALPFASPVMPAIASEWLELALRPGMCGTFAALTRQAAGLLTLPPSTPSPGAPHHRPSFLAP